FLALVTVVSVAAPLIAPSDPTYINPVDRLLGPSLKYPLGTDDLGRDQLSRLIYGGRVSLLIGATVTVASAVLGSALGLIAGFYPRLDAPIMRLMDGVMAFPGVLLAIAIVISLGARQSSVVLALTAVYVPVVARMMRGMTLVIRELPYVEAARAMGLRDRHILTRYVFANAISPLIVQATFIAAYAILAEASLSFLGASVDAQTPTWGNMLRGGQRLLSRAWWMAVAPGTILFLTVLACTLLGDGLRDAFDPRSRERRGDPMLR
ncbi:MAG TPA: ABC transporter permease, partial [Thermomicrobiales bacterium]|nr:ABC transporter permease [Thermomicrobiales bacterium]